jgi:hypothetical protein
MNPTTHSNLTDSLDSCLFIQTTCAKRTFDDYQTDRMFRRAIEREFEIVGEALKRIRDDDEAVFDSIALTQGIKMEGRPPRRLQREHISPPGSEHSHDDLVIRWMSDEGSGGVVGSSAV